MSERKYDLEDRLVKFAGDCILFANTFPRDTAGLNLSNQLIRSATSSALNFGESQGAESVKDKIHKLGIVLKELKESRVALKILVYINYGDMNKRKYLLKESDELIRIVFTIRENKRRLL